MTAAPAVTVPVVTYRERLHVPWWWWAVAITIMGGTVEAIFVAGPHFSQRGGWPAVIVAFASSTAIVAALLIWLSAATVSVRDGALVAGRHTLPASAVGAAHSLDREQTRVLLGPRARHDAVMCIRGWIPTAVRVDVADPSAGAPYWIVSTRSPQALAAALGDDPGCAGIVPADGVQP